MCKGVAKSVRVQIGDVRTAREVESDLPVAHRTLSTLRAQDTAGRHITRETHDGERAWWRRWR